MQECQVFVIALVVCFFPQITRQLKSTYITLHLPPCSTTMFNNYPVLHRPPSAPSTSRNTQEKTWNSEGILIGGKMFCDLIITLIETNDSYLVPNQTSQNFEQERKATEVFELNAAALRSPEATV